MKHNIKKSIRSTTAQNLQEKFDGGEDVLDYFDVSRAKILYPKGKRVQLVLPEWLLKALDHEANRLGIDRQDLVKVWISERLGKAA